MDGGDAVWRKDDGGGWKTRKGLNPNIDDVFICLHLQAFCRFIYSFMENRGFSLKIARIRSGSGARRRTHRIETFPPFFGGLIRELFGSLEHIILI